MRVGAILLVLSLTSQLFQAPQCCPWGLSQRAMALTGQEV